MPSSTGTPIFDHATGENELPSLSSEETQVLPILSPQNVTTMVLQDFADCLPGLYYTDRTGEHTYRLDAPSYFPDIPRPERDVLLALLVFAQGQLGGQYDE